ncbi:MAG: tetratricopeptide repeat protein, partial [Verrucomicrobiota bacterium]
MSLVSVFTMFLSRLAAACRSRSFGFSSIIVGAAVLIAFHEAPLLDFVDYDDSVLVGSTALHGGLTAEAALFAITEAPLNLWHPLTFLSHALDFQLFGDWAGGHHLTNVVFHLATALLLLAWLRRHTGENGLALAVTLLFAVHPLRVESVIWISERKDVLSAFFYLLTIFFYSLWAKGRDQKSRRFYWLAIGSAVLGLLSKPSLMTLPAALLLIDFWPLRRLDLKTLHRIPDLGRRLLEKIPFLIIALVAAGVAWLTWSGNQFLGEPPDLSLGNRAAYVFLAYLHYLSLTFFPEGMVAFQRFPEVISMVALAFAILLFLSYSAVAIWRREENPWLLFGGLWFIGLILPGSGLVTISDHFAPDRYTYLAHIGLFCAVVWGAALLGKRLSIPSSIGWAVLLFLLAPLLVLTIRQSRTWENPETLWRHAASVTERNHVALNQLGLYLVNTERFEEGVLTLEEAIAAYPDSPISRANLAMTYGNEGRFEDAVDWFLKAGADLPDREHHRDELVQAALAEGATEAATRLWVSLIEESPDDPSVRLGAGGFYYQLGETGEALAQYEEVLRLDPSNSEAAMNLGAMTLREGKIEEALSLLKRSVENAADVESEARARRTLAQAYLLNREWGSALEQYSEAVQRAPREHQYVNELAQFLLDCPDRSHRDPARALELARTLPIRDSGKGVIPNPRYLRTLSRALTANGEAKAAQRIAEAGLQVVEMIAEADPLPEPWTMKELESLR